MDWLRDFRVVRTRDDVLQELGRKEYNFRRNVGTVVFLCGAAESRARDRLKDYLIRYRPGCRVFYAESAWTTIVEHDTNANALDVEDRLASLADVVAVIVESPGTLAELGAFAMSPSLRRKLLLLLDARYRTELSFVALGPVKWVDNESDFAPSLWVCQDRILQSVQQIEQRLDRVPKSTRRIKDLTSSPKHLLFFLSDLVTIFGPVSVNQVGSLLSLLGLPCTVNAAFHLGLGRAMGILRSFRLNDSEVFYRPLDSDHTLPAFQHTRRYISIPTLRACVVAAMQRCEPGRQALSQMARDVGAA